LRALTLGVVLHLFMTLSLPGVLAAEPANENATYRGQAQAWSSNGTESEPFTSSGFATEGDPATDRIDVMGLYTPQARDAAGGVAAIEATIQAAVDNANTAFIDSDMTARFFLVHTALANHGDAGDLSADLAWLANDPAVAALRDTHGADLIGLLVQNGAGYCGIGYVQRNPGAGFASSAFQVTARSCAVGNLSYAHEHGHNMGFEHDPANGISPGSASYPWSFGHYVDGSYRTVMSYSTECGLGCTRVAHFSNPDVQHAGVPTGIANQRDNARTGDLTAPIIAAFRAVTAPIFTDGFESGDTSAWSSTVPAPPADGLGALNWPPLTAGTPDLFSTLEVAAFDSPGVLDAWRVAVNTNQIEAEPAALSFTLPDGEVHAVKRSSVERRGPGDLVWRGWLDAEAQQRVVLTLKNGLVAGRLETPTATYEIQPIAQGQQLLLKLDLDAFPECAGGVAP
jgi:hypothetical protein